MMQEQTIKISARRKMIGINFEDRIEGNVGGEDCGEKRPCRNKPVTARKAYHYVDITDAGSSNS